MTLTTKIQSTALFLLIAFATTTTLARDFISSDDLDSRFIVQYPMSRSDYDPDYKSNRRALFAMRSYFDTLNMSQIDSIIIVGSASPEGPSTFNALIAAQRAQSLKDIFISDGTVPVSLLNTSTNTDTWGEVFDLIKQDSLFPNRTQTLIVLRSTSASDRMFLLKKLGYNDEYRYLIDVIFHRLRNAATVLIYKRENNGHPDVLSEILIAATNKSNTFIAKPEDSMVKELAVERVESAVADTTSWGSSEPSIGILKGQKPLFALKTNLLYDVATILNVSLEIPIGKHWSIGLEALFPWWLNESKQNCLQIYSGNLEVKYWFGPRGDRDRGKFNTMTGWFLGVYGGVGIYDIEYSGKGYQGESVFSTGLMAGYAHSIGRSLRMEYSLGVGYMETHYRSYESVLSDRDNSWYLNRKGDGLFRWFGPTHAKISLVWMLNRNVKKGGVR